MIEADSADGLLRLSVPAGADLLEYSVQAVRELTRAAHVCAMQRLPEPGRAEVLAVAGTGGPVPGSTQTTPVAAPPRRIVLPLAVDGALVGAMVADGIDEPIPPASQRELVLLGSIAALAVQNRTLILNAERLANGASRRHYQLLSGTIYHLKNTLGGASEYVQLLELEKDLGPQQKAYLERGRRAIAVALRLLTELHDLGMADAGEMTWRSEPFDVALLIRDIVQDYRLAAGATTLNFDVDLGELPQVITDPDCLRQIIDTLMSNAVRYSPAEGTVTVRVAAAAGRRADDPETWIRVDVADNGPGVAEADLVFEEVQRMSRKGVPGFRLAIARKLARLLGGDIVLKTTPGEGSTFSLWLPARS